MEFRILFQDEFSWQSTPAGILVRRTGISADRIFVLQELRNQLGRHVYPVHRLDRGAAGVLLFAFDSAGQSIAGDLGIRANDQNLPGNFAGLDS